MIIKHLNRSHTTGRVFKNIKLYPLFPMSSKPAHKTIILWWSNHSYSYFHCGCLDMNIITISLALYIIQNICTVLYRIHWKPVNLDLIACLPASTKSCQIKVETRLGRTCNIIRLKHI